MSHSRKWHHLKLVHKSSWAILGCLALKYDSIANLDQSNPFPVLFLAPPPKGIQVWWRFGVSVPQGAVLEWPNVIGDGCVITVPRQRAHKANTHREGRQAALARYQCENGALCLVACDDLIYREQKGSGRLGAKAKSAKHVRCDCLNTLATRIPRKAI